MTVSFKHCYFFFFNEPFYSILQVNFFEDHTKLILSNVKGEYMVTFIDPERCAKTYAMSLVMQDGCRPDIIDRMAFARSMLKNLVDIEGADI